MAEANGWRKRDDFTLRLQTARVQVAQHRGRLGRYHRGCARFADRRQLLQNLLCACIAQCPDGQRDAARPSSSPSVASVFGANRPEKTPEWQQRVRWRPAISGRRSGTVASLSSDCEQSNAVRDRVAFPRYFGEDTPP